MKTFVCQICEKTFPYDMVNDHHERPQAAGGTDEDERQLCSGDHQNLHSLANMMMNPRRRGMVNDVATLTWPDPCARARAIHFANEVVAWMVKKKDGALERALTQKVMVELPTPVKDMLHVMARDGKTSVPKLIADTVCGLVYRQYPALRPKK